MNKWQKKALVNTVLFVFFLVFWYKLADIFIMPAGCTNSNFGFSGCTDKTQMFLLDVEPEIECLTIERNHCTAPTKFNFENNCNMTMWIEGTEYRNDSWGSFYAKSPKRFLEKLVSKGRIGNKTFEISYYRTPPLCR